MLRPELTRDTTWYAHDQRHAELTPDMNGILAAPFDDGVQCEQHEVDGHDLDTGRNPAKAAPTPSPVKLPSEIGVSRTAIRRI